MKNKYDLLRKIQKNKLLIEFNDKDYYFYKLLQKQGNVFIRLHYCDHNKFNSEISITQNGKKELNKSYLYKLFSQFLWQFFIVDIKHISIR